MISNIQYGERRAGNAKPASIFEYMKFIDPIDPNKVTPKPDTAKSIFDYYTPIKMKKPDINKSCYWDKRTFKIKQDIEVAVKRSQDQKRYELHILNEEHLQKQVAESANRRSNLEGELYML